METVKILLLLFWLPLVLGLLLQLGLLWLTKDLWRPLRFVGLALLLFPGIGAVYTWQEGGWFWELGVLIWVGVALAFLIGWGVAWSISPHRHRKKKDEN